MFYTIDTVTGETKTIYTPKELVKQLEDTMTYFQQEMMNARALARKTQEEVAAEVENQYAEENKLLKEKLQFSFGQFNSKKELNAWKTFIKKHESCRLQTKYDGGKMPYIIPYGTGIGQCVTAVCQVCGAREDITDTSVW